MFFQCVLTLTHASGILVDIDGIRVEELLPERFTGAEYTFDGDGNLVKSEVNGVVTYYLGKYYEKTVQNGHTSEKKHYSAGSSMIAVRTVVDGTQDTLNWLVAKHPVKGRRPPGQHESGYGWLGCGG